MTDESTRDEAVAKAQAETRAAFENRALMYFYIFDELSAEVGRDKAIEVMKRAIRRRGVEVGKKYAAAAEAQDLEEIGRIFCNGSPCQGQLFHPGVEETGEGRIVLSMTACPLMDAWKDLGLSPEEMDVLCDVSNAVDYGTFEGAGLELQFLERLGEPGGQRCLLELKTK